MSALLGGAWLSLPTGSVLVAEAPESGADDARRAGLAGAACPTCKALPGDPCHTPSGREASRPHTARLRPGRRELAARQAVWEELERRGATVAVVPFSGRAGHGGTTGTITLSRIRGR